MMNSISYRLKVFGLIFLVMAAYGCASTKASTFYSLNSMESSGVERQPVETGDTVVIKFGPVDIPDIIDRPQIVAYLDNNEVQFSDFDRWAGSLNDGISHVLMDNLSGLLSHDRVVVISWRQTLPARYRVDLRINKFGSISGSEVLLSAQWFVFDEESGTALHTEGLTLSEPIEGRGHSAVVTAMSRVLEELSREIAGVVRTITAN